MNQYWLGFSSRFFLTWHKSDGEKQYLEITKQLTKHLKGPYNRRNVYGALFSHGPILQNRPETKEAYLSIKDYALNHQKVLLYELGIDPKEIPGEITLITLPKGETLP